MSLSSTNWWNGSCKTLRMCWHLAQARPRDLAQKLSSSALSHLSALVDRVSTADKAQRQHSSSRTSLKAPMSLQPTLVINSSTCVPNHRSGRHHHNQEPLCHQCPESRHRWWDRNSTVWIRLLPRWKEKDSCWTMASPITRRRLKASSELVFGEQIWKHIKGSEEG